MKMPPKDQTILGPKDGWKEQRFYLVELAYSRYNPIHRSIFFSGFLNKGKPGAYNCIFNPTYNGMYRINDLHYLKIIEELNIRLRDDD